MYLWVCTAVGIPDIWGLVHAGTTVKINLVGGSYFQSPETGSQDDNPDEVFEVSLW